jgi:hypothetical protein
MLRFSAHSRSAPHALNHPQAGLDNGSQSWQVRTISMRGDPLRVAKLGPCRCYGGVPYTSAFEMKSQLELMRSADRTEDCACGADDDVIPSPAYIQKATISDDR